MIQNTGDTSALSPSVHFYLSDDHRYDPIDSVFVDDTFLASVSAGKRMQAGKSKTKKLKYKFPTGESASGKYIIAVIHADDTHEEVNENNNIAVYGAVQ